MKKAILFFYKRTLLWILLEIILFYSQIFATPIYIIDKIEYTWFIGEKIKFKIYYTIPNSRLSREKIPMIIEYHDPWEGIKPRDTINIEISGNNIEFEINPTEIYKKMKKIPDYESNKIGFIICFYDDKDTLIESTIIMPMKKLQPINLSNEQIGSLAIQIAGEISNQKTQKDKNNNIKDNNNSVIDYSKIQGFIDGNRNKDQALLESIPNNISKKINLLKMDWSAGFCLNGSLPRLNDQYSGFMLKFEPDRNIDSLIGFTGEFSILSKDFMVRTIGFQGDLGIRITSIMFLKEPEISFYLNYGGIYCEAGSIVLPDSKNMGNDTARYLWGYKDFVFGVDFLHVIKEVKLIWTENLRIYGGFFNFNYPREITRPKSDEFKDHSLNGFGIKLGLDYDPIRLCSEIYPIGKNGTNMYVYLLLNMGWVLNKL